MTKPKDPNAPLEAFQRHLDREEKWMADLGQTTSTSSGHTDVANTSVTTRGHLPTMDEQEGGDDAFSEFGDYK